MILMSGIFSDLYIVNTKHYSINDDMTCFNLSKSYRSLPEDCFIEEGSYEVKYGRIKNTGGDNFLIYWYDEYKPFTSKCRVYKIQKDKTKMEELIKKSKEREFQKKEDIFNKLGISLKNPDSTNKNFLEILNELSIKWNEEVKYEEKI